MRAERMELLPSSVTQDGIPNKSVNLLEDYRWRRRYSVMESTVPFCSHSHDLHGHGDNAEQLLEKSEERRNIDVQRAYLHPLGEHWTNDWRGIDLTKLGHFIVQHCSMPYKPRKSLDLMGTGIISVAF
ncbi:Uncharacterized protein Rs2_19168 [Raphanus sativus]|nr:Uncharacterized protein Rs2_19168 [Raphanus sativus]